MRLVAEGQQLRPLDVPPEHLDSVRDALARMGRSDVLDEAGYDVTVGRGR